MAAVPTAAGCAAQNTLRGKQSNGAARLGAAFDAARMPDRPALAPAWKGQTTGTAGRRPATAARTCHTLTEGRLASQPPHRPEPTQSSHEQAALHTPPATGAARAVPAVGLESGLGQARCPNRHAEHGDNSQVACGDAQITKGQQRDQLQPRGVPDRRSPPAAAGQQRSSCRPGWQPALAARPVHRQRPCS